MVVLQIIYIQPSLSMRTIYLIYSSVFPMCNVYDNHSRTLIQTLTDYRHITVNQDVFILTLHHTQNYTSNQMF